jgi:hypothetical protein
LGEDVASDHAEASLWAEWRNGSVLAVTPQKLVDGQLFGQTSWGGMVKIPLSELAALDRRRGPFVDLTLMAPEQKDFPASKVLDWSPKLSRSVEGRLLNLMRHTSSVGWGVKAPTVLAWKEQGPGVFSCWVGVDQEVRNHRETSPLVFRVLFDGVVVASSGPVSVRDSPKVLRGELVGKGKLELVCESFSDSRAGGSHGDWIAPRVWRK